MFDIKQLDNSYSDPQEQLLIALGVHPDQKDAQQKVTDALGSGTPKPDTAAATPAYPPTPTTMATGSEVAPIARPNAVKPIMTPDQRLAGDQSELDRLNRTGSGISQIHNPFVRTIARIGDIAGSAFFPGITSAIPGTELHHRGLVEDAQGNVENDLGVQSKQAQTAHVKAETDQLDNKPDTAAAPLTDAAGEILGWKVNGEILGPNNPQLTPDQRDIMAAAHGKPNKDASPEVQTFEHLIKGDPANGVAPMSHVDALQKINQLKAENKTAPVDQQELADFIKNPPKGYTGTPTQYAKWKASLSPAASAAAGASATNLTASALDQAAEKYYQTGTLPPTSRGIAGLTQNRNIMNRAAELHPDGNIATNSAIFSANKKSLAHLQQNFDQVDAFEKTAGKNLDVFLGTAKNVIDSGNPLINQPLRTITGKMGGTDQIAFDTARTTALTEIAKVLNSSNASGVLSDSARHEVEGLIGKDATLEQIYRAAGILKQDMDNRHQSYSEQIADIKGRMPGGTDKSGSGAKKEAHPEEKKYPGFVVDNQ